MTLLEPVQRPTSYARPRETITPETEAAIRKGVQDVLAGRTKPWLEVKKDLGLE